MDRDAAISSMDAAAQSGVRRYVMVSYLGAGPDHHAAETSRANVALVAAAVLELPAAVGRTIGFRDGSLPIAAALATVA